MRTTSVGRDVSAGCFECKGSDPMWRSPSAQGTAARHHDATGHTTWVDIYMTVIYGDKSKATSEPAEGRRKA